jgi:hypothetical protein
MGYSFLPLAIAGVTAPIAGGFLYYSIAEGMGMGRFFWGIVASIGLISASAFLHYDKHYNAKKKKKTWGNGFLKIISKNRFNSRIIANLPLFFIPLVLILGLSFGADPIYRGILAEEEDVIEEEVKQKNWEIMNEQFSYEGNLKEGKKVAWDILPPEEGHIFTIDLELFWEDEPDIRRIRRFENTEDTFAVRILINDSEIIESSEAKNDQDSINNIQLSYNAEMRNNPLKGTGKVEIELVQCGDFHPAFGLGLMKIDDSSNHYEVQMEVSYNVSISLQ